MPAQPEQFDIVIIGGGLVGASLAILLRDSGLDIAVVEAHAHDSVAQPSYDDRSVALSWGSRLILDSMGVWSQLDGRVEPILTIHISDRGHFGVTRLRHSDEQVEALGYVAENRVLGEALHNSLQQQSNVTLLCPARLLSLRNQPDVVDVEIEAGNQTRRLRASCLVAADGIHSKVRECLCIGSSRKAYGQSAIIANVSPGLRHRNVAYERFTADGPLAFLPLTQNRCSVVWTLPHARAEQVRQLDDDAFLRALQQQFGYRLGRLQKTGMRQLYPLALVESTSVVQGRCVVVGNAAHAVHPVAGQGFNLALRDIATLVDVLAGRDEHEADPGHAALLSHYQQLRQADSQRVYRFTDALIRIFSNRFAPLAHARACGLLAVDLVPFIKHRLARQSMGLTGRLASAGRR